MNPFAFVRAVRSFFDGPIVLSGGVNDGPSMRAARALGCDLVCMGTRFIATQESAASERYKQMFVSSTADDVILTKAFTGLPTSTLLPAILDAGLDPALLDETVTATEALELYGPAAKGIGPQRWVDLFSAGHSVSGVTSVPSVAELIDDLEAEYRTAEDPGRVASATRGHHG